MPNYRRWFVQGGTFFFTVVTRYRTPWFDSPVARSLLGDVLRQCFHRYPVQVLALVLLPDHLHTLWTLPCGDDRYAQRWGWIKREFTRAWLAQGGAERPCSLGQRRERRRGIWQRRFWEHTIRDEGDLENHFDYIHYNPVKHRLVRRVRDWPWSTFHRWVRAEHYPLDWGYDLDDWDLPDQGGEAP